MRAYSVPRRALAGLREKRGGWGAKEGNERRKGREGDLGEEGKGARREKKGGLTTLNINPGYGLEV